MFTKIVIFCKIINIMGKKAKLIISIFSVVLLIGAFALVYLFCFKTDNQNGSIKDIVVTKNTIVLSVGDVVDLKNFYNTQPTNVNAKVFCCVGNSKYATINENKILTAKNVGNTTIMLKVDCGNGIIEKSIDLQICEKATLPTNASFENETISMTEGEEVFNKCTIVGGKNYEKSIEYSVSGVCEYNLLTGKIIANCCGETIITVTFEAGGEKLSKSFSVVVSKAVELSSTKEIVILCEDRVLSKVDGSFEIDLQVLAVSKLTIKCKESDELVDCDFSYSLQENSCGLVLQADNSNLMLMAKSSGYGIVKITVFDKSELIKVKVG